jgi:hypothetical protein
MAKQDVKYKQIWKCPVCKEAVRMPKDAWDSWSKNQQRAFTDELDRRHLVHPV